MIRLIIKAFCLLSAAQAVGDCDTNPDRLGARYEIVEKNARSGETHRWHFTLWRRDALVAHQDEERRQIDVWSRSNGKTAYLVRYFDEFERGIEYQPSATRHAAGDEAWSKSRQLVSNGTLAAMELRSTRGKGCEREQRLRRVEKSGTLKLRWLVNLQLPSRMNWSGEDGKTEWTLLEIVESPQALEAAFAGRENYRTVDYADIGDHEDDPLLMKMITLGFKDHRPH